MFTWKDYYVAKVFYEDMLRRAEHERLVHQLKQSQSHKPSFWAPALAWLGRQLISLGSRLQARYDSVSPIMPKPQPKMR